MTARGCLLALLALALPSACGAPAGLDDATLAAGDFDQALVLHRLNERRAAAGARALEASPEIHLASARHAAYFLENRDRFDPEQPLSVHDEYPWWPGYTGSTPWERQWAAGFTAARAGGEVMHFRGDGAAALESWLGTIYHRVSMLQPDTSHAGHASLLTARGAVDVLDFGYDPDRDPDRAVLWPPDGASDVPLAFDGREVPDPPAPATGWPSGYPASVHFARHRRHVRLTHSRVLVDGVETGHVQVDPARDRFAGDSVFVYADRPLPGGARVTIELTVSLDGVPREHRWSFATCPAGEKPGECRR